MSITNKRYQTPDSSVECGITHLSVLMAKGNIDDSVSSVSSNSTLLQKTSFLNHDVSAQLLCNRTTFVCCSLMSCAVLPVIPYLHEKRMFM